MRVDYDKIMRVVEDLKEKQALSDALDKLITEINDSTDPNGEIELEITRTHKKFTLDASILTNRLSNQKQNADTAVDAVLNKITVNGK